MGTAPTILVADDDNSIRKLLCEIVETEGFQTVEARSGTEALAAIAAQRPDLLLLDLRMPEMDGMTVLERLKDDGLDVPSILVTAHGTASAAIQAIQLGAYDYITKPFDIDDVRLRVNRFFEHQALSREVQALRSQLDPKERIIGNSSAMREVYKTIGRIAATDATVLLTGESGTGKELVARTIHYFSNRRHGPLITVACASLPETLLESELFGHEKGSFTSAIAQRKGRFELANKGTIFLDEIGEMSLGTQKKLLRVLQEREFERVGGSVPIRVDCRVVAATNKNLSEEVQKRNFREDLFYRLNVIAVNLPPLRERKDDIPILVEYFLDKFRYAPSSEPARISQSALDAMRGYEWPGNVRQLENTVQRAVVMARGGVVTKEHLLLDPEPERKFVDVRQKVRDRVPMKDVIADIEKEMIQEALIQADGNRSQAATVLGVYRRLLYAKMKEYGIAEN